MDARRLSIRATDKEKLALLGTVFALDSAISMNGETAAWARDPQQIVARFGGYGSVEIRGKQIVFAYGHDDTVNFEDVTLEQLRGVLQGAVDGRFPSILGNRVRLRDDHLDLGGRLMEFDKVEAFILAYEGVQATGKVPEDSYISLSGYEVEFDTDGSVSAGCYDVPADEVKALVAAWRAVHPVGKIAPYRTPTRLTVGTLHGNGGGGGRGGSGTAYAVELARGVNQIALMVGGWHIADLYDDGRIIFDTSGAAGRDQGAHPFTFETLNRLSAASERR